MNYLKELQDDPVQLFFVSSLVSALILRIPVVGIFFRSVNTLIHESGHAITALLTNGEVVSIELNSDTSGTAKTKSSNGISKFLVSISGYPFASAVALLMFYFLKEKNYDWNLYLFLGFALLNLIFWVRSVYGLLWLLLFCSLLIANIYFKIPSVIIFSSIFLSSVLLIESVYSSAIIFYHSLFNPRQAGDAKNLKDITYIPACLWGIIFFAQSLYVVYFIVKVLFKL